MRGSYSKRGHDLPSPQCKIWQDRGFDQDEHLKVDDKRIRYPGQGSPRSVRVVRQGISQATPRQNSKQQPRPLGSCTTLTSAKLVQPLLLQFPLDTQ